MTAKPLVSILINNYNYARFLGEAINSALNQTYRNIEVIVVDDGSTDNSREIIANYSDRIIPVLRSNGGQASAFNAGFAASRGEIICLLDSDDLWLNDKVEKVVDVAQRYPSAVLIYHAVSRIDGSGKLYGKPGPKNCFVGNIRDKIRRSGGWWACPPTSGLSFRRRAEQFRMPEQEFRVCADAFIAMYLPFLGPVAGFPEPLTLYRIHGKNAYSCAVHPPLYRVSMIQDQVRRYRRTIDSVNIELQARAQPPIDPDRHWPLQRLQHKLGVHKQGIFRLGLRSLSNVGEPSVTMRAKHMAKFWLDALDLRPWPVR